MLTTIKKYGGTIIGVLEILLYLLPIISHGASYSAENELTGEMEMEVVKWHTCIAVDLLPSPLAPVAILGMSLAAAGIMVNHHMLKDPKSRLYSQVGKVILVLSVFFLAASWAAAQLGY